MGRIIVRRLLQGIPTFFGITVIAFLIMMAAPGDPITLITFSPRRDPASIESMKRQLGLDQPILTQYVYWLIGNNWAKVDSNSEGDIYGSRLGLLRGDLGESIKYKQPVTKLIVERIPATLLLTFTALIIGYGAGIALGLISAVYHKTWIDEVIRIITVIGNAVPAFWLGLILIIVFSTKLDILPSGGMRDITSRGDMTIGETVTHMIMPVFVLSLGTIAFVSRFMRTELLEVLTQDYIRTARSKGLANKIVWWKHAARNALIPVATFVGPALGTLLSGAVIIEQVFDWPGMGRLVVNAVFQRDYPLVMGSVVVASLLFIIGVVLSDIFYGLLIPVFGSGDNQMTNMEKQADSTSAVVSLKEAAAQQRARSLWQDALTHVLHDKLTLGAFIVLALLTIVCLLGPPLIENALKIDVNGTNTQDAFLAPGVSGHILGTDYLGRDQLIRLLYGGRVSLAIAYLSSVMIVVIGVTLGLLAGYYGGWVDDIIAWGINTLSSIPPLFLFLVIAALWQPSVEWLIVILALTGWVGTSRLVRGEVLTLKERDYVLAAQALGASTTRLLLQHIFPNLMSIVIVTGTIIAGNLILVESGLSYLGVGVQPPTPTWGNMLTDSRTYFVQGVHLVIWPGILILITVMCFYLVGDGLRDALDPHHSRHTKD